MQSMPILYDVVVVGAGLTGAAVAHRLAEAGRRVLVLEAKETVGGLSVHGCGVALLGTSTAYAALVEEWGADTAYRIWDLSRQNLAQLESTADALEVPFQKVGSLRPVGEGEATKTLEQSYRLLDEAGFDVALDDATDMGLLIGLRTEDDIAFEPTKLIAALLDHPNITLRTGVEVQSLKDKHDYVDIWARKHYVRAEKAVLTAGPHIVHLSHILRDVISSVALHTVDFVASTQLAEPWVLDAGNVLLCESGEQWRMTVRIEDPGGDPWETLLRLNQQFLPDARVLERHTGWIGCTPDNLPMLGPVPNLASTYVVGGLGFWGASWAFVTAEYLSASLAGNEVPDLLHLRRFFG